MLRPSPAPAAIISFQPRTSAISTFGSYVPACQRVEMTGIQVLIGFQGGATFSKGFADLPLPSKGVFFVGLTLLSMSMLMLMMPATYHRYVEQGEATERFHQFTSRILLWAIIPFGVGMCCNLFVVLVRVTGSALPAATGAVAVNVALFALWFGFMIFRRRQLDRRPGWFPHFRAE
ncbi:MAG TPA: DUF6328 family protein [Pirellulales bacterium]|nr:DUF6328 family protein [Pirellulales bacterium]